MMLDTVVLIDDNEDDNYIHRRYLERAGWAREIVDFCDPVEALESIRSSARPPDLVFVDLNMPELNGFELLDAVRDGGLAPGVCRFVVLTSSLHPDDRRRAEAHPLVSAYVEKPLNLGALAQLEPILVRGR